MRRSSTPDDDFTGSTRIFKEGLTPLVETSRLDAVLFQFPYNFHYTPAARRHLDRICTDFADLPIAVEFRNNEWMRDSVYEGLRSHGAALVNVDEPQLPRLCAHLRDYTNWQETKWFFLTSFRSGLSSAQSGPASGHSS